MVDAKDLVFGEDAADLFVERCGGIEVVAEGLLDNDATPVGIVFVGES